MKACTCDFKNIIFGGFNKGIKILFSKLEYVLIGAFADISILLYLAFTNLWGLVYFVIMGLILIIMIGHHECILGMLSKKANPHDSESTNSKDNNHV